MLLFAALFAIVFFLDDLYVFGYGNTDKIRFLGVIFEVVGAFIVLSSLNARLNLLQGHSLLDSFVIPIKSFPKYHQRTIRTLSGSTGGFSMTTGHARIIVHPKSKDYESLLEYVDQEIKLIYKRIEEERSETNKANKGFQSLIDQQSKTIHEQIKETHQLISQSAISHPMKEVFGIACVFAGLILSGAPELITFFLPTPQQQQP